MKLRDGITRRERKRRMASRNTKDVGKRPFWMEYKPDEGINTKPRRINQGTLGHINKTVN